MYKDEQWPQSRVGVLRRKWLAWAGASVNRQIFSASLLIAFLSAAVRLFSALKEIISAAIFGVGDDLDTFNVAFTLASIIMFIVGGAFQVALVPVYIDVKRHSGQKAAAQLVSSTIALTFLGLTLLIIASALAVPRILPFLAAGFSPVKLHMTEITWYLLIPMMIISGTALVISGALNAEEKFGFSAISPGFTSLCICVALLTVGKKLGTYAFPIGIALGSLAEFIFLFGGLRAIGVVLPLRFDFANELLRKVVSNAMPVVWASVVGNLVPVIEQAFAARLRPGDVAALGFGYRTIALFLGLFSLAVGAAVLPYFSKLAAAKDWDRLRSVFLANIFKFVLPVTLLASCILYTFSYPMIRLMFQRGAFTSTATGLVASVQAMYALQLPGYVINFVGIRLLSAIQANRKIIFTSVAMLVTSLGFAPVLSSALGVRGISLSTALVYTLSAGLTTFLVLREIRIKKQNCTLAGKTSDELSSGAL
jgi:putative peptidoglycan lipid II flippase